MKGDMGHTGGRCRASYSNTGGPPLPRKRAPCQKNPDKLEEENPNGTLPAVTDTDVRKAVRSMRATVGWAPTVQL